MLQPGKFCNRQVESSTKKIPKQSSKLEALNGLEYDKRP